MHVYVIVDEWEPEYFRTIKEAYAWIDALASKKWSFLSIWKCADWDSYEHKNALYYMSNL